MEFAPMFLSILFALALPAGGAPVAVTAPAQIIGCHPQPGKVMGCVTNSHVVAQQRAMGTYHPAATTALAGNDTAPRVACHPDPSRNRGCFRAVPGAQMKPAMAAKTPAPATPALTAQAAPAPSPEAGRTSG
jgi:hypothetical protein